jgi:hypothetical protein
MACLLISERSVKILIKSPDAICYCQKTRKYNYFMYSMYFVIVTHHMMTFDPSPFMKIHTEPLDNCRSEKLGQNNTDRGLRKLCFIAEMFHTEN